MFVCYTHYRSILLEQHWELQVCFALLTWTWARPQGSTGILKKRETKFPTWPGKVLKIAKLDLPTGSRDTFLPWRSLQVHAEGLCLTHTITTEWITGENTNHGPKDRTSILPSCCHLCPEGPWKEVSHSLRDI